MSSVIITMIWSSGTPCAWRIWYAWHTSAWGETRLAEGPNFGPVLQYCTRVCRQSEHELEPEDPPGDGSWTRCRNQRPALPTAPLRRRCPEPRWEPPPPPLPTVPTTSSRCLPSDTRTINRCKFSSFFKIHSEEEKSITTTKIKQNEIK